MPSVVRPLLELLTESVNALEQECSASGTPIPDLNEPFHPASEAFRGSTKAAEATAVIGAAALQLAAIVAPPPVTMYNIVGGIFSAAALRVCLESHVTEILREAGPKGMTPEQIATINGQDPKKLGRFLRSLATSHIYREIEPNVFTNNRVSSTLDTLKSYKEIMADPSKKNDNTLGLAALASHHLDEVFKSAAYSWEACATQSEADFEDPCKTPFNKAYNTSDNFFTFLERPEEEPRRHRFGLAMTGVKALQHPDAVISTFNWQNLPAGSLVVDVGGGVGTATLTLMKRFPALKYVVQDLSGVIEDAKTTWSKDNQEAISSGKVTLEAHDFFKPQTQKPAVFFLKQILHDWPDEYCVRILSHLRAAASPDTKLVVMDCIMPYACKDQTVGTTQAVKGYNPKEAPGPLLANYGAGTANVMTYIADLVMYLTMNSQERTITHHTQLLRRAGWKLTEVHRRDGDNSFLYGIEASPI